MLYLLFKIIIHTTSLGIYKLKDKIEKTAISKFGNNVEDILDEIYSNYTIIINKVGSYEYYVCHIFGDIL